MTDEKYETLKIEFFKVRKEHESHREQLLNAQKALENYQEEMADALLNEISQLAKKMEFYGYNYNIISTRICQDFI